MNLRLLAAAAVLAMIAGAGVAYCQKHTGADTAPVDCAEVAPAALAVTRPGTVKRGAPPRREARTGPPVRPSVSPSSHRPYRLDLDLDGDGC